MSERFSVGDVVIVRNDPAITTASELWRLEGEEVSIIGPLGDWVTSEGPYFSYIVWHPSCGHFYCAPHELRRRNPPTTGEQKVRAMFDTPLVERRRPATSWQAQYNTAQVLMNMGVSVKPGKWMVEGKI